MTYGHLQADCLYTGISSGPTLGIEYGKPLPLPLRMQNINKWPNNNIQSHFIMKRFNMTQRRVICPRNHLLRTATTTGDIRELTSPRVGVSASCRVTAPCGVCVCRCIVSWVSTSYWSASRSGRNAIVSTSPASPTKR